MRTQFTIIDRFGDKLRAEGALWDAPPRGVSFFVDSSQIIETDAEIEVEVEVESLRMLVAFLQEQLGE